MEGGVKVLVTGFGSFNKVVINPSWLIVSRLPTTINSYPNVTIITPSTAMQSEYHAIHSLIPALINEHDPDLVLHIGLDQEIDYFTLERSAKKEGYHEMPDNKGKVFTRGESKQNFGKDPDVLASDLDLDTVVERWEIGVRALTLGGGGKGKARKEGRKVEVKLRDDVGNFVCGFIYYVGLREMGKRGKRNIVFLHIPPLAETEIGGAVAVVEALIKSLVESMV
ncbi:peptidase C15, pyroglutamyl peptidase I-like protein [Atractiella rhizophila]|nr:peptidase C15, pyroglutamyl peptidase I-like protein [Atractiella rhizophila]